MSEAEARWARHAGGEPVEYLGAEALRALESEVTLDARGGLLLPRNEWVNNGRLVAALIEAARRRGVQICLAQGVEALSRSNSRVTGVTGERFGTIQAGAVVLAAGACRGSPGLRSSGPGPVCVRRAPAACR